MSQNLNCLFKIDKSRHIFYRTTDLFKISKETGEKFYQTEISLPIESIGGKVNDTTIELFGTTLNWFNLNEIQISYYEDSAYLDEDWQSEEDFEAKVTTILSIAPKNKNKPIDQGNYIINISDERLKGLEADIIAAIMTEIIPLVSNKKMYEETWQLKVSQLEDEQLFRKFFVYKSTKDLTTSKALRELLNFAFLCLKNGFMAHPNDPENLIRSESINCTSSQIIYDSMQDK